MKKTTCKNLKGPCDAEIFGATPEEMGDNSKKHVMEAIAAGDQAHKEAVEKWMKVNQGDQHKWFEEFKNQFDTLEDA